MIVILVGIIDINPIFKGVLVILILLISLKILLRFPHFVTINLSRIELFHNLFLLLFVLIKFIEYSENYSIFIELLLILLISLKFIFLIILLIKFLSFKFLQINSAQKFFQFWPLNYLLNGIFFFK